MHENTKRLPKPLRPNGASRQGLFMVSSKYLLKDVPGVAGDASRTSDAGNVKAKKAREDLSGMVFGDWTVICLVSVDSRHQTMWKAVCSCGVERVIRGGSLKSGNSKSCGHFDQKKLDSVSRTHGMSKRQIYRVWCSMRQRCNDKNYKAYKDYGGRGIKVCKRWNESFEEFYKDMGEKPSNKSLNRVNNDGDYDPSNCCWSDDKEQARNKRSNHLITLNGDTKCLAEWSELTGINAPTIRYRLKHGWGANSALNNCQDEGTTGIERATDRGQHA